VDGHTRPISTYEQFDDFQPQRHPTLLQRDNDKPDSNLNSFASSKSRFQSTPNITSPDLYGHSSHKRIEAIKNQGKNIRQKFKNLFGVKQSKKNFNLGNDSDQLNRPRTASSNDVDQQPQSVTIPANLPNKSDERSSVYSTAPQITPGHYRSSKIDTDVQFTGKLFVLLVIA